MLGQGGWRVCDRRRTCRHGGGRENEEAAGLNCSSRRARPPATSGPHPHAGAPVSVAHPPRGQHWQSARLFAAIDQLGSQVTQIRQAITAVLPKIPHSNCSNRVPNRPLRPHRGRFGTLLEQLECWIFGRTAESSRKDVQCVSVRLYKSSCQELLLQPTYMVCQRKSGSQVSNSMG